MHAYPYTDWITRTHAQTLKQAPNHSIHTLLPCAFLERVTGRKPDTSTHAACCLDRVAILKKPPGLHSCCRCALSEPPSATINVSIQNRPTSTLPVRLQVCSCRPAGTFPLPFKATPPGQASEGISPKPPFQHNSASSNKSHCQFRQFCQQQQESPDPCSPDLCQCFLGYALASLRSEPDLAPVRHHQVGQCLLSELVSSILDPAGACVVVSTQGGALCEKSKKRTAKSDREHKSVCIRCIFGDSLFMCGMHPIFCWRRCDKQHPMWCPLHQGKSRNTKCHECESPV